MLRPFEWLAHWPCPCAVIVQQTMTRAVAIALALILSSAPIGNIVCAAWCDARLSSSGGDSAACHHGPIAHLLFGVGPWADACEAFASALFIREDTHRVDTSPDISIDIARLPALFTDPDRHVERSISTDTQRWSPHHGHTSVLRI